MTGSPELRASDADRDRAVGQLREHSLAGRLTVEELDERSAAAFAAKTVGELDALLADLPRERAPAAPARAPAPVQAESGGFGRRPFTYVFEHPVRPGKVMEHTLATMALAGGGYELVERDDARLVFDYTYRPGWVAIPCILIPFPGLLCLLIKEHDRVTVELEPLARRRTRTVVRGRAPRRVRRAFARLGSS